VTAVVVGLDHRTAPIELREQLYVGDAQLRAMLTALQERDLDEVVVLSTCNRLEVLAACEDAESSFDAITTHLAASQNLTAETLRTHLYCMEGPDAARHLFRLAAGLESLVLGETQIMGQVAGALAHANEAGTSGPVLSRLFATALHAGKRARTETGISRHTVSVSHAAVLLIEKALGDIAQVRALIVGAGEMAGLAADALRAHGATDVRIINRTYASAQALAQRFGAQALEWHSLPEALRDADVVMTATSAPHPIIQVDAIAALGEGRSGRPVILVDIGVPRNIDRHVSDVAGVQLYHIEHLQAIVADHRHLRQSEVRQVEDIIAEELQNYMTWLRSRQVVPVITALRRKAEAIANEEIERTLHRLPDLEPREQEIVAQMVRRLVNKLLHTPTVALKSRAARGDHFDYAHATRKLFALEEPDASHGTRVDDE
jgi:glutamyl-tRNA reductase